MLGYIILAIMVIVVTVIVTNTIRFSHSEGPRLEWQKLYIDVDRVAKKMSEAVKVATVSYMDTSKIDYSNFDAYHKMLEVQFPECHKMMTKEVVAKHSLLYKWTGKTSSKKPVLFMSHIDVVPIADGTTGDWEEPPFSGVIKDGFVWGRGTEDTKVTMIGALESAELLIEKGYEPDRDIYFAFGHDEEIQGSDGAASIVKLFEERGIRFEMVLDEGGIVSPDSIAGTNVALVGICEKGYLDAKITVKGSGGHASMPPKSTALGQLATVLRRLEVKQMKARLTVPAKAFLMAAGPVMSLVNRIVLANLWLFKPLFMFIFTGSTTGNAMLRTTTAVTMAEASNASNVLPQSASGTVNFRILPGETRADVVAHIKKVSGKIDVEVEMLKGTEPSEVSSATSDSFLAIKNVISHVFEDTLVAPYLVMAATDSRYYGPVADNVYRFAPITLSKSDLKGIHGTNEKISFENLRTCVSFYTHLMMEF